jgi:hypothetical protein
MYVLRVAHVKGRWRCLRNAQKIWTKLDMTVVIGTDEKIPRSKSHSFPAGFSTRVGQVSKPHNY